MSNDYSELELLSRRLGQEAAEDREQQVIDAMNDIPSAGEMLQIRGRELTELRERFMRPIAKAFIDRHGYVTRIDGGDVVEVGSILYIDPTTDSP